MSPGTRERAGAKLEGEGSVTLLLRRSRFLLTLSNLLEILDHAGLNLPKGVQRLALQAAC